jgi:hypothetical protein
MDLEPTVEEREILDALRHGLRREFQRVGRGSRKKTLGKLGASESTLDMAFRRGSLKVVFLLRILKELGAEPGEFFLRAFRPLLMELEPEGDPPLAVRIGLKRLEKEGWPDGPYSDSG